MKSIVMPVNDQLTGNISSKTENYQETAEVKEINTADAGTPQKSHGKAGITVVDMWNQQRNRRLATHMIRSWNLN